MPKTKKKLKTRFKFTCPIFDIDVYLIIGERKDAEKFCNGLGLNDFVGGGCWEFTDGDKRGMLVWVDALNYYHMIHESLHLTQNIFLLHGIPFNKENDEMIAYYQNYWIRKFWNKMSKFVKDKK